jgi:hypothetical protein
MNLTEFKNDGNSEIIDLKPIILLNLNESHKLDLYSPIEDNPTNILSSALHRDSFSTENQKELIDLHDPCSTQVEGEALYTSLREYRPKGEKQVKEEFRLTRSFATGGRGSEGFASIDRREKGDEIRLQNTWNCILPKYFNKCINSSTEKGPGINLFKILNTKKYQMSNLKCNEIQKLPEKKKIQDIYTKSNVSHQYNCEYHYIIQKSSIWNLITKNLPNLDKIMNIYDYEKHILIAVHINSLLEGEDPIRSIRILENNKKCIIDICY